MSSKYEALSAFLDGETSEFETRRVLRDLEPEHLDILGRWQRVSDVLHGHATVTVSGSFNARLSEAVASEPKPARRAGVMHGFARVAVAASVAAVTVIGWQNWSAPTDVGAVPVLATNEAANDGAAPHAAEVPLPVPATQQITRPFGETSLVAQRAPRLVESRPTVDPQPRVDAMLLRHSEFTARHSGQGLMPYARLVSMDARNGAR